MPQNPEGQHTTPPYDPADTAFLNDKQVTDYVVLHAELGTQAHDEALFLARLQGPSIDYKITSLQRSLYRRLCKSFNDYGQPDFPAIEMIQSESRVVEPTRESRAARALRAIGLSMAYVTGQIPYESPKRPR